MTARSIIVGDHETPANESEWLVAISPTGTRLRITPRTPRTANGQEALSHLITAPYEATLLFSWWYDGVIAECESDDGKTITVHPAFGDVVEVVAP